jgi:hypothetical protein
MRSLSYEASSCITPRFPIGAHPMLPFLWTTTRILDTLSGGLRHKCRCAMCPFETTAVSILVPLEQGGGSFRPITRRPPRTRGRLVQTSAWMTKGSLLSGSLQRKSHFVSFFFVVLPPHLGELTFMRPGCAGISPSSSSSTKGTAGSSQRLDDQRKSVPPHLRGITFVRMLWPIQALPKLLLSHSSSSSNTGTAGSNQRLDDQRESALRKLTMEFHSATFSFAVSPPHPLRELTFMHPGCSGISPGLEYAFSRIHRCVCPRAHTIQCDALSPFSTLTCVA